MTQAIALQDTINPGPTDRLGGLAPAQWEKVGDRV